jgi:hypothetical protein
MDRFTRNYSIGLIGVALVLLSFWLYSLWTPRVWELNDLLAAEPVVAAYPYAFRVTEFNEGIATLSTPRSFAFPAIRFLPILEPELANLAQDDPRLVAAQQRLIDAQQRAMELVQSQPDVRGVRWELDIAWLADHGVQVRNPEIVGANQ